MNTLYLKIGGAKIEIICYYSNKLGLNCLSQLQMPEIGFNAALVAGKFLIKYILE